MHMKGSHPFKIENKHFFQSRLRHELKVFKIALPSEKNEMKPKPNQNFIFSIKFHYSYSETASIGMNIKQSIDEEKILTKY